METTIRQLALKGAAALLMTGSLGLGLAQQTQQAPAAEEPAAEEPATEEENIQGDTLLHITCDEMLDLFAAAAEPEDEDEADLDDIQRARDEALLYVAWTHGYLSGKEGIDLEAHPVDRDGIIQLVGDMTRACRADEDLRFVDAVDQLSRAPSEGQ